MNKTVIASCLLLFISNAHADTDTDTEFCQKLSTSIPQFIEKWHELIKNSPEGKNLSPKQMFKDFKTGKLEKILFEQCLVDIEKHKPDYKCLMASEGAFSAQMCTHPNMSETNWEYIGVKQN
jgi:hypothetical protein